MYKEGEAMNQKRDITDTEFENGSMVTIDCGLAPIGIQVPQIV